MLYRFQVSSDANTHSVFVKAPLYSLPGTRTSTNTLTKPSLYPKTDTQERHWLQYTALVAIYEYFNDLHETQFGAIRALDYLPEYYAVFTEDSNDPNLRQLLLKESRWHFPPTRGRLTVEFHNVGAWLQLYHRMPKKDYVNVRHEHRQDYIDAIVTLVDFLKKTQGDDTFLKATASKLINQARAVLPETLPLGLGHGDYAMRNILVGPNHRVTVLDTFAKWQTPIYEDVGYFINELKMSFSQVFSQGMAFSPDQMASYEDAFLKGYFGEGPVPYPAIRLYEALAMLDKWSSFVAKFDQQPGPTRMLYSIQKFLFNRYFKDKMKTLLAEI